MRQNPVMKYFKHFNMEIMLSPLTYCDLTVPDGVALDDPTSIYLFELSQYPGVIAHHKLDETAQCQLFSVALQGLVNNRDVFPRMRSIKLEVSLHAKKSFLEHPNDPLDRCGIILYITIKLERQNLATSACRLRTSLPTSASGSVPTEPTLFQRAEYEADNRSPHPNLLKDWPNEHLLDPRRHILGPLRQLIHVQSVQVERRWTVRYRQQHIEDGSVVTWVQPLRKIWRYRTVDDMLEGAGSEFGDFLDPGLEHLNTTLEDVVEIVENTSEDIEHQLIP